MDYGHFSDNIKLDEKRGRKKHAITESLERS